MPNYTLAELMSHATTRAGRRADIDKSDVSFMVNLAWEEVARIAPHVLHERVAVSSTTSGDYRVTLPSDFDSPINLSIFTTDSGSGKTLTMVSPSYMDESGFWPVGEPQRYMLYNNWLELHPAPDSGTSTGGVYSQYSLQIRYQSFATDLVAETDVPSCSTSWRKAILYGAEAEVWAYVNNPTQEAIARQRYLNYVAQVESDEAKRKQALDRPGVWPVYPEVRTVSRRSFDVV
jgi:hypothetical protein